MKNRAVITGMGVITPLGLSVDSMWSNLVQGNSGIDRISRFDVSGFSTQVAAEVRGFDPQNYMERKEAKRMDRFAQFAMAAAHLAVKDAGIPPEDLASDRAGVLMGTGIGGIETLTEQFQTMFDKGPGRVSPFFIPMMIANMACGQIAIALGAKGPSSTVVTACAAASNAVGDAYRLLQWGKADVMICGGAEAPIVPLAVAGFCSMKAMSTRNDDPKAACRPFDAERDGFVMGEGAGMFVLETLDHAMRRGANILAEVVGYGVTQDAYHITAPAPGGDGGARCMALAIEEAGLRPEDIDYINAHGTSTPANDKNETEAIKTVFGEFAYKVPVSSTKSMTGHLLGAAGAVELAACVMAMRTGIIPPTINYVHPDPECDLDYVPNQARKARVTNALSNSFGFGGQNACLVIRQTED
ncbi:MAG: beta-ketoacyl-ACP synthase II [Bacillota bacterium]|nr:beta-ketoacyl-ACP synthase II [Bacillota bacterium]